MTDKFPDLSSKLGAPTKKSLFERQKAEAEAKKARETAETAAVYEDFVKSFDEDGEPESKSHHITNRQSSSNFSGGQGHSAGPGKRHFTSSGLKSGPGSLGGVTGPYKNVPGSVGSGSIHGRKRGYDDFQGEKRDRSRGHGMFSYEDERLSTADHHSDTTSAFRTDEDYDTKDQNEAQDAAKPTLHLSSLPPGTSPTVIKALFTPSPLSVEEVRILPPPAPNQNTAERKSTSAIVTLAAETPAADIDTVVSHLQNKYLGFGYNLSISRHLSSAALGTATLSNPTTVLHNLPFGAKPIQQRTSLSRAPPPGHGVGRFAPPSSYTSSSPYGAKFNLPHSQVTVQIPSDLKQLKRIHKTLEALLTYGPEFEALLMSRPEIQHDSSWAWLWDSRTTGGIYYRWRLWDILTDGPNRRRRRGASYAITNPPEVLFESQSVWQPPDPGLRFEYTTSIGEFISDEDYNSSDEEADDDGGIAKRYNDHNITSAQLVENETDGTGYLNPLTKTKLIHLLARLPESNAKLRKGDVARITGFAIEHAGAGAGEVAELVTRNVVEPFRFTGANSEKDPQLDDDLEMDGYDGKKPEKPDTSSASLVGLYAISDILSSSASAGVRHAWRYRALFEAALRQQKVFDILGRMDRDLGWGKLKAEKWKRSIHSILSLWEGWCVFPQTSHEEFVHNFNNPPLSEQEKGALETEERRKAEEEINRTKNASKWKSLEMEGVELDTRNMAKGKNTKTSVDGEMMMDDIDLDGEPMDEDEGASIGDLDGVSMIDSSDDENEEATGDGEAETQQSNDDDEDAVRVEKTLIDSQGKRQRPRAVDMFAEDSDNDG